jgi:hypothetical protein
MIPKYPYIVRIRRKTGAESRMQTDHAYETFGAACASYTSALKEPRVTGATVMVVLDETTKQNGHDFYMQSGRPS